MRSVSDPQTSTYLSSTFSQGLHRLSWTTAMATEEVAFTKSLTFIKCLPHRRARECFRYINHIKSVFCFKCSHGFPSHLKLSTFQACRHCIIWPLLTYPTLSCALPLLFQDHKERVGPQNKFRGSTWQRWILLFLFINLVHFHMYLKVMILNWTFVYVLTVSFSH